MIFNPTYINGLGNISPQETSDNSRFLEEIVSVTSSQLKCQEPNYKDYVSGDTVRRMSRIIKLGISSAKICLKDAECSMPDAIITGTGLGCMEDTEKFLATMIRNKEELLTPTSFIQSTHNTVSGQIALLLKCHNHNFTYCHRGFSFESSLLDALLQIQLEPSKQILVGGLDELTANSYLLTYRLGHWKRKPINTLDLINNRLPGSIAGEGSAFFLLSGEKSEKSYARLHGIRTILNPTGTRELHEKASDLLANHGLQLADLDLVLLGLNGDPKFDRPYQEFLKNFPVPVNTGYFKHLCGEYHTASAFACWLSAMILKFQKVPEVIKHRTMHDKPLKNILVYNHYRNLNHTFMLFSRP